MVRGTAVFQRRGEGRSVGGSGRRHLFPGHLLLRASPGLRAWASEADGKLGSQFCTGLH